MSTGTVLAYLATAVLVGGVVGVLIGGLVGWGFSGPFNWRIFIGPNAYYTWLNERSHATCQQSDPLAYCEKHLPRGGHR